jgi:hypothetical protein
MHSRPRDLFCRRGFGQRGRPGHGPALEEEPPSVVSSGTRPFGHWRRFVRRWGPEVRSPPQYLQIRACHQEETRVRTLLRSFPADNIRVFGMVQKEQELSLALREMPNLIVGWELRAGLTSKFYKGGFKLVLHCIRGPTSKMLQCDRPSTSHKKETNAIPSLHRPISRLSSAF